MSLNETLLNNIYNVVEIYMDRIASKYDIDKQELQTLWNGEAKQKTTTTKSTETKQASLSTVDSDDLSEERLMKCTKAELVALCKMHKHKCTGTKVVLLSRLLGKDEEEVKTAPSTKKPTTKKKNTSNNSVSVIKKLTSQVPSIPVRRNNHNNYEHPETGLVFDKKTQRVLGKQQDDGSISELTPEDINMCKKFKFDYSTPENLDQGNYGDVQIQELDDSDEEFTEEEVEIDEDEDEEELEMVLDGDEDEYEELSD